MEEFVSLILTRVVLKLWYVLYGMIMGVFLYFLSLKLGQEIDTLKLCPRILWENLLPLISILAVFFKVLWLELLQKDGK